MNDPLSQKPQQEAIPGAYFNGFILATSNADAGLILRMDNKAVLHLKCSYTTLKTLAQKCTETIEGFEALTGHTLMTIDEINLKIKEAAPREGGQAHGA